MGAEESRPPLIRTQPKVIERPNSRRNSAPVIFGKANTSKWPINVGNSGPTRTIVYVAMYEIGDLSPWNLAPRS